MNNCSNTPDEGGRLKEKHVCNSWRVVLVLSLCCLIFIPVTGSMTRTIPAFPLSNVTIGNFTTDLEGGYPLLNHSFSNLTESEWISSGQHKNQTLSIFPYVNPPLFPNETVYGLYHEQNGYVSWLKEMTDPGTGLVKLCQVADTGEFGEKPYMRNLSPAENDYLGRIEWLVVDGKIWPRTWINGTMYDGQTWTEWWGPFSPGIDGSLFRKRDAVVSKKMMDVAGKPMETYLVTITGPGEFDNTLDRTEVFYFVDGIGPVGRDHIETNRNTLYLHSIQGMPEDAPETLPAGDKVFSHSVRCNKLFANSTMAMYPR